MLLVIPASGVTRWIDFDTGGDGDDGQTAGNAWLTEDFALSQLTAADILKYVRVDDVNSILSDWELLDANSVITQTKEIEQFAITWTVNASEYHRFGRYATGDFWIADSDEVIFSAIDPLSTTDGTDWTKNGSVLNPNSDTFQGMDSTLGVYGAKLYAQWSPSLNVAHTDDMPITIRVGNSLCSAKSKSTPSTATNSNRPQLSNLSVLTIVDLDDNIPVAGDFRPSYSSDANDKVSPFNVSDMNDNTFTTALGSLGAYDVGGALRSAIPSNATITGYTDRVWFRSLKGNGTRFEHPSNNLANYDDDNARNIGDVFLWLSLDKDSGGTALTNATKQPPLYFVLQTGIDWYGVMLRRGNNPWASDKGTGVKWPIVFAGIIFNEPSMYNMTDTYSDNDDGRYFYVTTNDIATFPYQKPTQYWENYRPNSKDYLEYAPLHEGMPDWGVRLSHPDKEDTPLLSATYRYGANPIYGHVLGAMICNYADPNLTDWGRNAWDHEELFEYMDRWFAMGAAHTNYRSAFAYAMWDEYRANYGTPYSTSFDITAEATPTALALVSKTATTITISWSGTADFNDLSINRTDANLSVNSPLVIDGLIQDTTYNLEIWGRKANGIRSLRPATLTVTTEGGEPALPQDLIVHYTMDDDAGQTDVLDSSGNNYTGTAANNIVSTTGQIDEAITFNGTTDAIVISDNAAFDLSSTITVVCWAKSDLADIGAFDTLVAKNSRTDNKREWQFFLDSDEKINLRISEDGTKTAGNWWDWTTDDAITTNVWHHYAFTFDEGAFVIYLDGVAVDATDAESNTGTTFYEDNVPVTIGSDYEDYSNTTKSYFWDGAIDDVRIYNIALTPAEIAALFANTPLTPIAHYTMDDAAGQTGVADSSGNGLNGIAINNITSTVGKIDEAITFDGDTDTVVVSDNAALDFTTTMSVTAWCYHSGTSSGSGVVASKFRVDDERSWCLLQTVDGKIEVRFSKDGTGNDANTILIETAALSFNNAWHHIAFTWDTGVPKIYYDGAPMDITYTAGSEGSITSIYVSEIEVLLGSIWEEPLEDAKILYYKGNLDDIRIYNKVLTDAQVLELFIEEDAGKGYRGRYQGYRKIYRGRYKP